MSKEKDKKATAANTVLDSMSLTSICVQHNAQLCESNGRIQCHPHNGTTHSEKPHR